jgi:hypothetical protein
VAKWTIELTGLAIEELEDSLNQGPILDDQGRRLLLEREVDRIGNLKIYIYSNEHPPPHFLVQCPEGSCRFEIADCSPLDDGLATFRRNIKKWHKKNKQLLIDTWNESRPSDCPVGEYREAEI